MLTKNKENKKQSKVSFWTISVLILLVLFSAFMAPKKQTYQYNYKVGDITRMDIIAPYDFDILKQQSAILREQAEAIKKVNFVFSVDDKVAGEQLDRTELFFQMAKTLEQRYNKYQYSIQVRNLQRYSTDDFAKLNETVRTDSNAYFAIVNAFKEQYDIHVAESPYTEIYAPSEGKHISLDTLRMNFITHLSTLFESGITDIPLDSILSTQISIRKEGVEIPATVKNMFDRNLATEQLTENLAKDYDIYSQKILISKIAHLLIKPNMIYDKERTTTRQEDVIGRIPLVVGKVFKDEKIVGANTLITQEIYQKLLSLNYAEEKRSANLKGLNAFLKILGDVLIMSIFFMMFVLFLIMYDKSLFTDVNRFLLLIICIVIALGLGSVVALLAPAHMILVPISITAMLLMIFFDERVALMGSAIVLLVLAYIMGGSFRFILMHAFPAVMAIIALRRSKTRENVLRPLLFVLTGYFVTVSAMNIASLEPFQKTLIMMGLAFGNAIVSVLVTNGLMMVIERIFGVTTSLSLLELSDMNRPLLKRLSLEAPGTFNHSIVVGNLLEAAAEKIGANSLLARVGAYYHDIGKLSKADYFVENQQGGENKLNQLKPHMAAKVIISHVRNGLELAEQEKLPDVIKDFIATHHGTMTVDYFYQKALSESGEEGTQENEFRYPGPTPKTKETALLMIVEAAEAAVRSLPKATPRSIEAKIKEVIAKRLNSGQLDECPLKFVDLTKIFSAIYPLLVGLYHERIPYPEDKKDEDKKENLEITKEEKA
ncbi:MAG: HDIG domain-containing protein [Candidatus Marinimicrobia bacterium]|nr:HDIG domain-containing protein [Candidatus Neomarinimicrobiota bacterium]